MKITNFEQFKFECQLAFLEESLVEEGVNTLKWVNLTKPKLNQTSNYLFPSIKLQRVTRDFSIMNSLGFINLYSYFDKIPLEYCLHILFNPPKSKLTEFDVILEEFRKLNTFVECTMLDENVYVISLMMFEEYKYVFYPFINGEYTKLGAVYASLFPSGNTNGQDIHSKQYHVINHTEFLQQKKETMLGLKENALSSIELDEKIHLNREILNYNYIKNNK